MNVTDAQSRGYPALADILTQAEALGLEGIALGNTSFINDYWKSLWGLVNSLRWAMSLGVYPATATTFNVRGGNYLYDNTVKTYTPGAAINPTDNDTTYIWMKADNTIGSAVDGTGWTTDPHIKLAEIDVDADGVITAVRDLRDKLFLRRIGDVPTGVIVGTSDSQVLTTKTISSDSNTITNLAPDDLKVLTSSIAIPFIISAALTAGNTVAVYAANAPFKFRVVNAWSVAKSADAGTWKLTNGANDITNAVAVTATDKTVNQVGTLDDAYYEIAANGSLSVVGDGSLADVDVYIECIKVS
jgi:hypothetical protein